MRNQSKFILRSVALASAGLGLSCNLSCSGPPAATVANIVIDFPGTTASDAPLLLYSGTEAGNCVSFAPHVAEPDSGIVDLHLYTFNAVDVTERWRVGYLEQLRVKSAA